MTCRRCFARWALRLRPPRCSRMRGYPPPPIARAESDCLPAGCLRRVPVGLQGTVRWQQARRPVPRGTSWHGTCARVPRKRALLPRRGSGPALVPPRILEVASTSTYTSLVHSSLRSNRKEGAARRPVGKLTRSQGDGHGLCLRGVGECRHLPGPLGLAVTASWWGSEGSLWGVQRGWGLQCRRLAGVAATAETKHFVLGTWRSRTERGSRTDGRGCRAHIPRRPLPVTLPSTAPAGPPLCPGPPAPGAQPPLGPASEKGRRPIQGG